MTTVPEEDPETHRIAIPIHLEPASPFRGLPRIRVGRSGYTEHVFVRDVLEGRRQQLWLPPERTSPREAREFVRAVCEAWGIDETRSGGALVVVTELVTNAAVRARTACVVRVARAGVGLRIDVEDSSPRPMPIPGRGPVDLSGPRALGLRLVGGLTTAWGVADRAPGKLVWAILAPDPASS